MYETCKSLQVLKYSLKLIIKDLFINGKFYYVGFSTKIFVT